MQNPFRFKVLGSMQTMIKTKTGFDGLHLEQQMNSFVYRFDIMADLLAAVTEIFDEDDSSLDIAHIHLSSKKYRSTLGVIAISTLRNVKSRIPNYVETVYRQYSIDDFKDRFRMSRDTFERFVDVMSPFLMKPRGISDISSEKKLLVFVKYLSTQITFQCIADIFGICETSVHSIIHDLSRIVCKRLMPNLIRWPKGNKVKEVVDAYQELSGFPGVIGAIDGSHIPIPTPTEFPENYINRKQFPSIVLQAVCESNLKFTDVFCGWPGSVHDSRIMKNSPFMEKVQNDYNQTFPANTHLIGDSAYALTSWMMVPFKDFGKLTKEQKRYNYHHSSTRMCIERAFGALKGRFRRLKYVDLRHIPSIVEVVLSCCTLHQLCIDCSEDVLGYINEGLADVIEVNAFEDFMPICSSAENKRNAIMSALK